MSDSAGPPAPPPAGTQPPPPCPCGVNHDPTRGKAEMLAAGVLMAELLADETAAAEVEEPNVQ